MKSPKEEHAGIQQGSRHAAGCLGKTTLVVRCVRDEFVEVYNPTIEEAYGHAFK
ncbi:hypothetical protein PENSPDRAFT_683189 [Peniophora sp. CONT]|nr:hypothetical protein PENSPDRAFT_683189 [Peniophora sp. CONT]